MALYKCIITILVCPVLSIGQLLAPYTDLESRMLSVTDRQTDRRLLLSINLLKKSLLAHHTRYVEAMFQIWWRSVHKWRHSLVHRHRRPDTSSDTTKRTTKTSQRKRKREFFWDRQSGMHWSCYVLLFTDFMGYWTLVCHAE